VYVSFALAVLRNIMKHCNDIADSAAFSGLAPLAGTRFTYPGGMKGRVNLVDLIAPPRQGYKEFKTPRKTMTGE